MPLWMTLTAATLTAAAATIAVRSGVSRRTATATIAAALISATVSLVLGVDRSGSPPPTWSAALLPLAIEFTALTVLVIRFTHRAGPRTALPAAAATGLAIALLVLRLTSPPSFPAAVGACGLWSIAALTAAAIGLTLRSQDRGRQRHAEEARREQRLRLARDLHDFVAHDVSEMLALAQAGQVAGTDPADLFRRIEQAGQHAMTALDRTVHTLDSPGLEALSTLVDRFRATGHPAAELTLDPALPRRTPPAVSTAAYRIVAEALTNIRRHAPAATFVRVAVTGHRPDAVTVTVTNGRSAPHSAPPRTTPAGRGLPGLATEVETLGGTLAAHPHGEGWRLTATLPLDRS
ncbi:sensor histidine kinase [Dactylosporangium sp. NPDC051541]|uniref:sensor histidine kinase n=1 Tax=Dactylosporangium sp. NPDC051541 TaxID=3363977 RepID=UPI0037AD34D8